MSCSWPEPTAPIPPCCRVRESELGTIEVGKLADLVLLGADPLDDISNTQKIEAVIVNGRYLGRADLDAMLSRVEAEAK